MPCPGAVPPGVDEDQSGCARRRLDCCPEETVMNGSMPRHHAARVEAAIASGQAARSALVASWRRSSRLHHLDPSGRGAPLRLSDAELRQARERIAPLLAAAQGVMDRLYQAVGASGCCVLLADGAGVPVDRRGTAV